MYNNTGNKAERERERERERTPLISRRIRACPPPFRFGGSIGSIKFEGSARSVPSPPSPSPFRHRIRNSYAEGPPRAIFIPRFGALRSLFIQPLGNAPLAGVTESPWQLRVPLGGTTWPLSPPRAIDIARTRGQGYADQNFTPVVARARYHFRPER